MKPIADFEQRMQCLKGTFAVENMKISHDIQSALKRLEDGAVNFDELVNAAILRHTRRQ